MVYESGFQYTLSVVPLFILMGNFVTRAGMSKELYRAAYAFVGHLRGGLAMATVIACAGFGAICGSSIATAATMTKVAYPSMRDHGYSDALVGRRDRRRRHARHPDPAVDHHGHLRDHDRDQHRQAVRRRHHCPACSRRCCSASAVQYITWRDPEGRAARPSARPGASGSTRRQGRLGGRGAVHRSSWAASTAASSPRPRAPASAPSAPSASRWRAARSTWRALLEVLVDSARTTAMLFMILVGALMFANFVNYTTMPADLKAFVTHYRSAR